MLTRLLSVLHGYLWAVTLGNLLYLRRADRHRLRPPRWPRVSVLVPARNEARNLRRLLPSLLRQDYPDLEVIVYDDGSDDETSDVARSFGDARVRVLRGEGPPEGWVGKVHALYQATRHATGRVYLFLDADTALQDARALRRLVERWTAVETDARGAGGVLTGLPQLRGGGQLLISLVPFVLGTALPMWLVPRSRSTTLGALNGQCWLISAEAYHRHEPHAALPNEILEDVEIGRFLKARGLRLTMRDLRREVAVWMYRSHREAWAGFRKNAYLIQGGTPARFLGVHGAFLAAHVAAPLLSPRLAASSWALKALSDRRAGLPWTTALAAPLSLLLAALLPIDSAVSHWTGRVRWKGRRVGPRRRPAVGANGAAPTPPLRREPLSASSFSGVT